MTIKDTVTPQFLALFVFLLFTIGGQTFATFSMLARWDARDNPPAVYIQPTEWAQVGFKGTIIDDFAAPPSYWSEIRL